jgi:hypothetical protein
MANPVNQEENYNIEGDVGCGLDKMAALHCAALGHALVFLGTYHVFSLVNAQHRQQLPRVVNGAHLMNMARGIFKQETKEKEKKACKSDMI